MATQLTVNGSGLITMELLPSTMPTDTCPETDCEETHEFTDNALGNSFECDCGAILRVGRSNGGDLELVHHPLSDMDDMDE